MLGRPREERLYRVYRDFMWLAIIVPDTKDASGTMRDISETGARGEKISYVIGGKLKGPLSAPWREGHGATKYMRSRNKEKARNERSALV